MGYMDRLISCWRMSDINPPDEGWRGLGNDGVGVGLDAATDIVQGIHGNSMATEFAGSPERVVLTTPTSLQIAFPISVAMWVKRASAGVFHGLFENDDTALGYGLLLSVTNADKMTAFFYDGGGTGVPNRRSKLGTTSLVGGRWYHLVYVFQGATDIQLYLNGVDDLGTYAGTGGAMAYSGADGHIGKYANQYTIGVIDSVQYYAAALTQLQAMDLMLATRQGRI